MTTLSASVMAHPKREPFFAYLKERLGEVPFSIDTGFGIIENCKRAWQLRDKDARWHVVIQDDAIICDDFFSKALEVIEQAEAKQCAAISFYFGRRKMLAEVSKKAMREGYYESGWLHWGPAVCLRSDIIEAMLADFSKQNIPQDDTRIANFLKATGYRIYYPVPSLVQHRVSPSLVGNKCGTAYSFIGEQKKI